MSAAFSTDGSEEMVHGVGDHPETHTQTPSEHLRDVYELHTCINWIQSNRFKRVALQFPDDLLCDSMAIAKYLWSGADTTVFILGDTSYGSCCVDEVAAEHHEADSLIHFGHTCHSPTQRIPVMYVYGQWPVDVDKCTESLRSLVGGLASAAVMVYDLHYHYIAESLAESLRQHIQGELVLTRPDLPQKNSSINNKNSPDPSQTAMLGRLCELPACAKLSECILIYIGQEGRTLTNWMMNLNRTTFYSYDPNTNTARKENGVNQQVSRRLYMIEKAKDAKIIGILVGTLGVAGYLNQMAQLKSLVKRAGKKSYTFVVGKLNVAKLANFLEVDVYVMVSCPENALIDSSEFYRPVITPYELEVALNDAREFTGDCVTDFRQLLPGGSMYVEAPSAMEHRADVSLITGGTRQIGLDISEPQDASTGQLTEQALWTVDTIAGDRLAARSWQGLEQKLGKTPVMKAVEGRRGIAMGYKAEPQTHAD